MPIETPAIRAGRAFVRASLRATDDAPSTTQEHIALAEPVAHPWFVARARSPAGLLLGLRQRDLDRVLAREAHVVLVPGETGLARGAVLSLVRAAALRAEHPTLATGTGSEAVEALWIARGERAPVPQGSSRGQRARAARVRACERAWERPPASLLLHALPVSELRGENPSLDARYERVLRANERVRGAPTEAHRSELWRAVRGLFFAGDGLGSACLLRALRDARAARAERTVNLAAACTLAEDGSLDFDTCALSVPVALEVFAPWVLRALCAEGFARDLAHASELARRDEPSVHAVLRAVAAEQTVVLVGERATEHAGVAAFSVTLSDGAGVARMHPGRCGHFGGAGATVRVFALASAAARHEARARMGAARSAPRDAIADTVAPSGAALLGLYLATQDADPDAPLAGVFRGAEEIARRHELGTLALRSVVELREPGRAPRRTTAGRALAAALVPCTPPDSLLEAALTHWGLRRLLQWAGGALTAGEFVRTCEGLWRFGLEVVARSGTSPCADDFRAVEGKAAVVREASARVARVQAQYEEGEISAGERLNKRVDLWTEAASRTSSLVMDALPQGDFRAWIDSGAGPARSAMRRYAGMPGVYAQPSGEIHEVPVFECAHEGFSPHGFAMIAAATRATELRADVQREGEHSLRAQVRAALARVRVRRDDCGAARGRTIARVEGLYTELASLATRAQGRVPVRDVTDPRGEAVLARAGERIDGATAWRIEASGVARLEVRSPLHCLARPDVCALCWTAGSLEGDSAGVRAADGVTKDAATMQESVRHLC